MKSPDEIKKGLAICCGYEISCRECPYDCSPNSCDGSPEEDAIEYINQLEIRLAGACGVCAYNFTGDKSCLAHIKQLESRLAQVERERDAAAKIIEDATTYLEDFGSVKFALMQLQKWRGVCSENTKEEK